MSAFKKKEKEKNARVCRMFRHHDFILLIHAAHAALHHGLGHGGRRHGQHRMLHVHRVHALVHLHVGGRSRLTHVPETRGQGKAKINKK